MSGQQATVTVDRTAEGWDTVVDAYDAAAPPITSMYAEDALRLAGIGPGDEVLDLAAGTGAATFLAARKGARVFATDVSPAMVARLRRHAAEQGLDLRAEVMDAQALDLPDGSFDAVISTFGFMFFPDQDLGFSEAFRVLRPGGRLAIATWSTPDKVPQAGAWGRAMAEAVPDLPPPPVPPAMFSLSDPARLVSGLESAGFREVRVVPVSHEIAIESPEKYWDDFHAASPLFVQFMKDHPDKTEAIRTALIGILREQVGDGPGTMAQEALVSTAVKP